MAVPEHSRDDEAEQQRQQMRPVTMPDIPPFRIRRNEALFRNLIGEQGHRHAEHRIAQRLHAPHLEKPGPARHRCSPRRHSGMIGRTSALWSRNDEAVLTLTSSPRKRGTSIPERLEMESRSCGVLDTRWSLSSGSPKARPGGG